MNETGDITTDPTVLKRVTREYYEQLYSCEFDNLDIMDQVLEKHKLLKVT